VTIKKNVEITAAAIAASVLGAKAKRRDVGGSQMRDFDLIFPDGHVEPLEVTRHFDRAATETWERLAQANCEARSLSRVWTVDIPSKMRNVSGGTGPYPVREFLRDAEPALRQLEEAGYDRFELGMSSQDPSVASADRALARLGVQTGLSRELLPGERGRINGVAPVGGLTDPGSIAEAIEAEASDLGNRAKLRKPATAPRRHLFVVFDSSSGSAFNALDRGMLGRLPNLPEPITTAWALARHRVFFTSPPEPWQEHAVPSGVFVDPSRWLIP
jgi:hypothetical protein